MYQGAGTPIQDAIDGAGEGDTIYVHAGLYYENLNVGKRLSLKGDGADVVTVRVARTYHVFEVTTDWVNISGFTVVGATSRQNAGIYLYCVDHCNISENNISNNDYGIYLKYSSNNTLSSNTANSKGDYGIYLDNSRGNTLSSNTANSNNDYGIYLKYSSSNTLSSNTANSNNDAGIYVYHSSSNTLSGNTANSTNNGNGILLYDSSSNTLSSNTANSNNDYGIRQYSSSNNNMFTNNNCSNNGYGGIYLDNSRGNTLSHNTANSNNRYGIYLRSSSNNMLSSNTANSNNNNGIYLYYSSSNTLSSNIANSNNRGIYLKYSSSNMLQSNAVSGNNYGIELYQYSDYNTLHRNNLIGNTQNAYDRCISQWDSGTEGNYYSDYIGTDSDDDGIGDTPHPIPGGSNIDRYPLTGIRWLPSEITRSRLGINTHWYNWAEDFPTYKEKIKNFGIIRDGAWWYDLETSDLTGSEWDHANWDYPYDDLKTFCGREMTYQSGYDNLVKLYQGEDSPELLMVLNQENDEIKTSLKWEVTLEEEIPFLCEGVFALANDILYVSIWEGADGHGKLYALNASTGSEKWSFDTGATGIHTPAVANGIVYICGWKNKMVYALDAATGVEKWHYQCGNWISSPPMIADGALHVGAYDKLYVFGTLGSISDAPWPMSKHGATRTGYNSNEDVLSPPLVKIWDFEGVVSGDVFQTISSANGTIYIGIQASIESWGDSNKVYAIDATTGLKRWEFTLDGGGSGAMDVTPAVANGLVYFGGQGDDKLYALDAETGQKVWEFTGMGTMYGSHPAVVDGVVYAKGRGMLYALNASTGVKIWESPTAGSGRNPPSPAILGDTLYIGSSDGFLYAIDTKTGTEKWNLSDVSRTFSYPLISDGVVYMDASNTVIKALDASSFETITADQYYDYVYHIVERYDGDGVNDMPGLIRPVRYFEVGNEVDYVRAGDSHDYLSPKDYVEKRLVPAYNAAKVANKDAVIMGGGLGMESDLSGNDIDKFNTAYLEAMYDNITVNGGNKNNNFYMDKIAIHYYSENKHPEFFDGNIKMVKDVIMSKEGREKPIWITEFAPASPASLYARLFTLMFANKIEMPVIYNLKDDSEKGFGLYDVTCVGDEETITPRESIQVIDTVVSTLHGTTPSEAENKDISAEPGKTTYQRVFNDSGKKVTVLWYIDDADPDAITNCVIFPESPQTFTVDVLGTANFSTDPSPIHLKIGSNPTYVVETDPPIDLDLYFNKTTTAGVATERATSFAVGDTLYGKVITSTSTNPAVRTYITMTMPDGTCRYAYYDKPDFVPGSDRLLFSETKAPLYDGVWNATINDWLWNIYEFTGDDSGTYRWNCWYEDVETGEILGGNSTEYTFLETPSGTPVDSSTGRGEVYLDSSAGTIEDLAAISPDDMSEVPESLNPVYGFFSFEITGISSGESVNIPLAFPENVPAGTEYWKYGPTPEDSTPHWYQIPVSDDDGDRIIVITLTDGGIGDDDLTENGVIVDDGGPSLSMSKKGDLNGDGALTPADAAIALRIAATGAHNDAADVSGDGRVTSLDALMILQAAADAIDL